jgi:hypothetical protein
MAITRHELHRKATNLLEAAALLCSTDPASTVIPCTAIDIPTELVEAAALSGLLPGPARR